MTNLNVHGSACSGAEKSTRSLERRTRDVVLEETSEDARVLTSARLIRTTFQLECIGVST